MCRLSGHCMRFQSTLQACVLVLVILKCVDMYLPTEFVPKYETAANKTEAAAPNETVSAANKTAAKRFVRYNRALCSGLGDRITVILNVAAFALTMNATCYMYWCEVRDACLTHYHEVCDDTPIVLQENAGTDRYYAIADIQRHMVMPANVVLLTVEEFAVMAKDAPDISYTGGALPAGYAYDGVYTLAPLTMSFPGHSVAYPLFLEAYRRVGLEWTVHDASNQATKYIVLHLRQDDKKSDIDEYVVGGSPHHCTFDILSELTKYEVPVFLISDDDVAKRRLLSDFGHHVTAQNKRYCPACCTVTDLACIVMEGMNGRGLSKIQGEVMDVALLMGAAAIVQHVEKGWSSFSSVVAMAKQIPLVTTLRHGWNRLDDFATKGSCPQELMKCDQLHKFWDALNVEQFPLHESLRSAERLQALEHMQALKKRPEKKVF